MAGYLNTATQGHYTPSQKSDWRTPDNALAPVRAALGSHIDVDPCASPNPDHWFAKYNMNPEPLVEGRTFSDQSQAVVGDGLKLVWGEHRSTVFVNPPYEHNKAWIAKCAEHGSCGREVILLIPCRSDTHYWQDNVCTANAICFWRGRLRFVGGAKGPAPFPVAFIYWGIHPSLFRAAFRQHGLVYCP